MGLPMELLHGYCIGGIDCYMPGRLVFVAPGEAGKILLRSDFAKRWFYFVSLLSTVLNKVIEYDDELN